MLKQFTVTNYDILSGIKIMRKTRQVCHVKQQYSKLSLTDLTVSTSTQQNVEEDIHYLLHPILLTVYRTMQEYLEATFLCSNRSQLTPLTARPARRQWKRKAKELLN